MAKWKATMLTRPKNASDGFSRELCKGYMMIGEEVQIQGGLTLDFRTKNVFYYVLKAGDHFCYQMVAYRDKKHSKKKDDPPVLTVRYTGQVLVHRFFIGSKDSDKEAIFVVIHAKRPIYYKPDQKQAETWFKEFSKVVQYSKEKIKQLKRPAAPAKTAPINSPERYTPTQDDRYLGEYVSMRSLPGPKKSPDVTRPKVQEQRSPTATVAVSGAMAKRSGNPTNPPDIKQNHSKAQRTPKPGLQKVEVRVKQGANTPSPPVKSTQKVPPHIRKDTSSANSSGQSQTLPKSSSRDPLYDELSIPSEYAPEEITFDEMDSNTLEDDGEEGIGTKPSTMTSLKVPRKPVKRGRSIRRLMEDGKFVWDMTPTASDEEDNTPPSQQAKSSHHHLIGTIKTGSSPSVLSAKLAQFGSTSDQVLKKKGELKKVSGSPGSVSVTSTSHQRVTTSSSIRRFPERLAGRRRSISDPADPSSLLPLMHNLGGISGMYDERPFGQRRIASALFIRESEQHESVKSSESQRPSASMYLESIQGGHHHKLSSLDGISGQNQTDGRFRDPNRDPLPIPLVIKSAKTTYQKRHSDITTDACGKIYHTYDEITSVQKNSRQLVAVLSHEQADGLVNIELKKHDANKGLVFVRFKSKIWIASWKKDVNGLAKFQQKLHIGDELISVDGNDVRSVKQTTELIGSSSGDMVKLLIHRMPLAKVVFLTKSMTDTWGCEFSKNEITKMYPGPLQDCGMSETPYGPTGKETTWVVTECQHQPIPIITCDKDEVKNHLFNAKTELPLVVHPKDFIDGLIVSLKKNQKIAKNMSDYQL